MCINLYTLCYTLNTNVRSERGDCMNKTELYIKRFYQSINIYYPYQLTIGKISTRLNLSIIYWPYGSEITLYNGIYKVFINENLTMRQQWQDFGHEMKHYIFDKNSLYVNESFAGYLENKADYFAYHFCAPTFMLLALKEVNIYDIMNLFNVEYDFALRRLEMYQNKILSKGVFA